MSRYSLLHAGAKWDFRTDSTGSLAVTGPGLADHWASPVIVTRRSRWHRRHRRSRRRPRVWEPLWWYWWWQYLHVFVCIVAILVCIPYVYVCICMYLYVSSMIWKKNRWLWNVISHVCCMYVVCITCQCLWHDCMYDSSCPGPGLAGPGSCCTYVTLIHSAIGVRLAKNLTRNSIWITVLFKLLEHTGTTVTWFFFHLTRNWNVPWQCAAQTLPAPLTAWQSYWQSQWRPSSVPPGRYSGSYMQIQAHTMTYMQIPWHTCRYMVNRYMQLQMH